MPRQLALLLVLVASSAHAQDALVPDSPTDVRGPTAGQRVLLVAGAVGGGVASGVVFFPVAPLGAIAGAYGTGRVLGLDAPSPSSILVDAAISTGVGYAAGAGMLAYLTLVEGYDADLSVGLGSIAFGFVAGAATMGLLYDATRPVDLAPVTLRQPDGSAHGLAIQIGL